MRSTGIYMLDYESEVFIWVGRNVPKESVNKVFRASGLAVAAVSCKGMARMRKISMSLTWQGYEPQAFTRAFKTWEPFEKHL